MSKTATSNALRAKAFRFTGLARVGYFHDYDARALPWLRGVGDEIGLSRSRRGNQH